MLYRRIFIQVPLQFVYVIKLFILKVGNNLSTFFCEYRFIRGGKEECQLAVFHVKLFLTDLSTCQLSSPPQKEIFLTQMYHLKLFRNNNQGSFQRERCLLFWFSLEDWGNKYLPPKLSAQNRVFSTLMLLLELNTK